ncbi:excalibur calcium-binding domain-containing protein [Gryllotalpicola ginsengisoli]|uniref:excalibur calcium-binding domain-containing protein n=1 Tax=Gryllotalpicola ginsengisoli TaxID=444608 RepID=UPI00138ACD9A|nr:excalibur calcium-binding domain-containing protein [Gryllotalpicola ginsengisoli]
MTDEQPALSGSVSISGTARVGATLTAATDGWPSDATLAYQWFADGTALPATGPTLTLAPEQLGASITVTVTGTESGYADATATSDAVGPVAAGVLTKATPTISGTVKVGSTVTAHPGTWTSGTAFAYQWYASSVKISGATHQSYTIPAAYRGKTLTVHVTGTLAGYTSSTLGSKRTAAIASGTLRSIAPKISGTAKVGSTLTAIRGSWGSGVRYSYQWLASGRAIPKATHSTFTPTAAQLGKSIIVKVTGSKPGYTTAARISARTHTVVAGTLKWTTPKISGTARVGSTLTAIRGTWSSGTSFSFQWYASGKAISKATRSTLVLTSAQKGARITVRVTGRKAGYTTVSKLSAATAAVTAPATTSSKPARPGDVDCSDFATHAQAQAWFAKYYPYYGDVAGLDSDNDGSACESLP